MEYSKKDNNRLLGVSFVLLFVAGSFLYSYYYAPVKERCGVLVFCELNALSSFILVMFGAFFTFILSFILDWLQNRKKNEKVSRYNKRSHITNIRIIFVILFCIVLYSSYLIQLGNTQQYAYVMEYLRNTDDDVRYYYKIKNVLPEKVPNYSSGGDDAVSNNYLERTLAEYGITYKKIDETHFQICTDLERNVTAQDAIKWHMSADIKTPSPLIDKNVEQNALIDYWSKWARPKGHYCTETSVL
jgi:hypothetical protein